MGCAKAAGKYNVDVAIVAFNAADFAAFQHSRRQSSTFINDQLDRAARDLAEKARRGELALFVGAGVSMSAGLPSWDDLLHKLRAALPDALDTGDLDPLDIAELVSREVPNYSDVIRNALQPPVRAGLSHLLLAGLGCEETVTTNFDLLYERAAMIDDRERLAVLPWDSLTERRPWL